MAKVVEQFDHDDCPKCGTPSVPFEGVADQSLRGCPNCEHDWWEDLSVAPKKGAWGEAEAQFDRELQEAIHAPSGDLD